METLVVVAQHRNQYYNKSKSQIPHRFGSSPLKGFREINCRSFQSEAGILPTPFKSCNSSSVTEKECFSPKTPESVDSNFEDYKPFEKYGKSSPIPIISEAHNKDRSFNDDLSFSELWAGPAYSHSPPPSSLPIPKFSLRQNRSISFELPVLASGIAMHQVAKSAPSSPTREPLLSQNNFRLSVASATKDLRRILHLDICDE